MDLMEATSVSKLPRAPSGNKCRNGMASVVFSPRHGSQLSMQSKGGRDLVRYFPEVASGALKLSKASFILDGENVIETKNGYGFDTLLQRIHPAASRIKRLASETPATFIVFDILSLESTDLAALPLLKRRRSHQLNRQAGENQKLRETGQSAPSASGARAACGIGPCIRQRPESGG